MLGNLATNGLTRRPYFRFQTYGPYLCFTRLDDIRYQGKDAVAFEPGSEGGMVDRSNEGNASLNKIVS